MTDTSNDFLFGLSTTIAPMLPVVITSRQQAFRTAAWIILMSAVLPDDGSGDSYEEIFDAIANT